MKVKIKIVDKDIDMLKLFCSRKHITHLVDSKDNLIIMTGDNNIIYKAGKYITFENVKFLLAVEDYFKKQGAL